MGAISFDGTLPVCSWAYVNICGWKGTLVKSFLCLNMWVGFCMCLSAYWRICQEQLKVTKKVEKPRKDLKTPGCFYTSVLFFIHVASYTFVVTRWQHACTLHLLIAICLFSPHTWSCSFLCSKTAASFSLLCVAQRNSVAWKCNFELRPVMNDSTHTLMIWWLHPLHPPSVSLQAFTHKQQKKKKKMHVI